MHRSGEDLGLVANFLEQTGATFTVLPDQGNTINSFAYPPGANAPYPREIIIGKDLTIRSIKASYSVEEVDALIRQLLAEP